MRREPTSRSDLFDEILREQKYNNTNRTYYHGTNVEIGPGEGLRSTSGRPCVYLTTDPDYACEYLKESRTGFLYMIRIVDPLEVFNAKSTEDRGRFLKYFRESEEWKPVWEDRHQAFEDDVFDTLHSMMEEDWLEAARGDLNRNDVIHAVRDMGYDGFFNYEDHRGLAHRPAVGLFVDKLPGNDRMSFDHPSVKLLAVADVTRTEGGFEIGTWKKLI